jgi:hypothetical protein
MIQEDPVTFPQTQTPSWAGPATPQQPAAPAGPPIAQSQEVEEATFGGSGMSAPFLNIGPATRTRPAYTQPGQPLGGIIVRIQNVHAHKRGAYDQVTGKYAREPQYYKKGPNAGKPIMQFKLTLQTDLRDPAIEGDTGLRAFELTGMDEFWKPAVPANCRKRAARLAVEAAGAKSLAVGGQLLIAWTAQVDIPGAEQPSTNWVMQYTPPGSFATFESAPPAAVAPAPVQQPAQAAPVAQAPAQPAWAVQAQPAAPATPSWAK